MLIAIGVLSYFIYKQIDSGNFKAKSNISEIKKLDKELSKESSVFDCKILIYSYYKSTDGTSLDFKNNIFTGSYTDSIDSIDSYKIERLINIFNIL